jgi:fructokinase
VINILDPDVIVLGGGLSNIDRLYVNVPKLWGQWVFGATSTLAGARDGVGDRQPTSGLRSAPPPVETRLVRAKHGDSSGVRGAARLWP